MPRPLLAVLLFLLAPAFALAGEPSQDELKKKKEEVLKDPFLKKAPWMLDYDRALAEAKKTGKPVFAYFTRSFAP
ncbi:MAG: hypothetical protein FD180_841 [Planctomycetota bacterium]|nr:MAG: hypothetical protein FD180_841 [Planctomycetota bacterium]